MGNDELMRNLDKVILQEVGEDTDGMKILWEELNSDSNILSFQKMFRVVETDYESMAVLDWVFPGFDHVSEELPEKTSLQRRMKKYLLEGKKIGWALGVKF